VAKAPWRSIASGTVERPSEALDFDAAMSSPCATCGTAPCCSFLPLHRFRVDTLTELDYARYLINFQRLELGLSPEGDWNVYYRHPCRHLERDTMRCAIHDQPAQPNICKHFNPYSCWYRGALRSPVSDQHLRIDHPRMEWIAAHTRFDDERAITGRPTWDEMAAAFAALPCDEQPADEPPATEPVHEAWHQAVIGGEALVRDRAPRSFQQLAQPCDGCAAWCCTAVSFPYRTPQTHSNVDYLRFLLGFPGVELGVHDGGWTVVVRTTCRHLVDNRCSLYGRPERPLACRYYDAHQCVYRTNFGEPRPPAFVRVRYDQFASLARTFAFDASGLVLSVPTAEQARAAIEEDWCAQTSSPSADPVVHHRSDGT
jgi:Fe-S-cluster containining protein